MKSGTTLSKEILQSLASEKSFAEGEKCYQNGNVMHVTQTGQVFTATVKGSGLYRTMLRHIGSTWYYECSCPYKKGGLCKHGVALGLALINKPDAPQAASPDYINAKQVNRSIAHNEEHVKLAFLEQLLKEEPIRQRYAQFIGQQIPTMN